MSFEYLDALPAQAVPLYGVSALERQATELRRGCELFLLPAEAIGGGKMQGLKRLNAEISRMSGIEAPASAGNPFAELDAKYVKDLADAAALGNMDLLEHLEKLYALEAQDLRRRLRIEREGELTNRLGEIETTLPPAVMAKLQAKARRQAEAKA